MRTLHIQLLGPIEFHLGKHQLQGFKTRKSKALFSYLILNRGRILPREIVASEFWAELPDCRARNALNTDFWRINQVLRNAGAHPEDFLQSDNSGIGFLERSNYTLDIARFDQSLTQYAHGAPEQASDDTLKRLANAVALYRGDLLQDIFDDWCLVQREQLRVRYLSGMEFLLQAHMHRKEWDSAIEYAQRLLAMDPLQEHIHRALMRCHYLVGNRPAAVRQYAGCVQLLRRELGVEPMEETTHIYETIMAVTPRPPEARQQTAPRTAATPGKTPLEEVNLALANLETARGWLVDASDQLSSTRTKPRS